MAVFAVIVGGQPTTDEYDDHSVDRLYESVARLQAKVAVLEAEQSADGPSKLSLVHYWHIGSHFIFVTQPAVAKVRYSQSLSFIAKVSVGVSVGVRLGFWL